MTGENSNQVYDIFEDNNKTKNYNPINPFPLIGVIMLIIVCLFGSTFIRPSFKQATTSFIEGDSVVLTTPISGRVKELFVEEGKPVQEGKKVFEYDERYYEEALDKANLEKGKLLQKIEAINDQLRDLAPKGEELSKRLKAAEVGLKEMEKQYLPTVQMYKEGSISKQEYDEVLGKLAASQSLHANLSEDYEKFNEVLTLCKEELMALEKSLEKMDETIRSIEINLKEDTVYASEDGIVEDLSVKNGDNVTEGQFIMKIAPETVSVIATFDIKYVKKLKHGLEAQIVVGGIEHKFKGYVEKMIDSDEKNPTTIQVKLNFDEDISQYDIESGMSVISRVRL